MRSARGIGHRTVKERRVHTDQAHAALVLDEVGAALGWCRYGSPEELSHLRNSASRAALTRLGAAHEGVLRRHMVMRDGWIRDSALYSITGPDWPDTKNLLMARLDRRHPSAS
ncbi:GNAT family N-acetyltransferase [Streptomyces sp. NPDC058739]|uniref:GNAT family N-acetyltransferase n=1 Tax=Streptomyces sp. NPDC058739 TaxID=3346618 RepID=UPI003677B1F9